MEPDREARRLPRVSPDPTVSIDAGAVPAVFDLETRLDPAMTTADLRAEFHDFYVGTREHVGRALALTLRDTDLAADAVDEAMVRAFQNWTKVRRYANREGWVYRVGLNHARSRLRRLARRRTQPGEPVARLDVGLEPAILTALGELSVDHRSVVVCRLVLDWSEADTAAALGIRPGTVKSRLARAVAQLQQRLDHLRPEDLR
jgi:RNA polymerase sigma-70 factor (ECF subfamily)